MVNELLVLDLTGYLPGPYATQLLADFGARVVKVESPAGDPVRHIPPYDAQGLSASFGAMNHGKESLGLDLKQPAGRDLLLRLVEQADVLVEGFRPGVLERLGLGAEVCLARNPRLIWCSLSGFGQDGPYRDKVGHDINYLGYSGALAISAGSDGLPVVPGLQVADTLASLSAVVGILLAVCERERSGQGRVVDASMLDAAVSVQGLHFAAQACGGPAGARAMALNGGYPCYDTYLSQDGKAVALGALEPKFWAVFCDTVGKDEWLGSQFDPSLRDEIAALIASRTRDEWRVILENMQCCVTPILDYDEVRNDPQVVARGLVEEGRTAPPVRFQPPLRVPDRPCPERVGAHSRPLLAELLGLSEDEIEGLMSGGAVVG